MSAALEPISPSVIPEISDEKLTKRMKNTTIAITNGRAIKAYNFPEDVTLDALKNHQMHGIDGLKITEIALKESDKIGEGMIYTLRTGAGQFLLTVAEILTQTPESANGQDVKHIVLHSGFSLAPGADCFQFEATFYA